MIGLEWIADRCLPVEQEGRHFVIAEEWLNTDLEFPLRSDLDSLVGTDPRRIRSKVLVGSRLLSATVFVPVHQEDVSFAVVDTQQPELPADSIRAESLVLAPYLAELHARCSHTEFVIPEQRSFLESEFVQPNLRFRGKSFAWSSLHEAQHLFIVGTAGAGKTTLLRRWILNELKRFDASTGAVPVYAVLRAWNPEQSLSTYLRRVMVDMKGPEIASNFDQLASVGRLALVLDGLDEVPFEKREDAVRGIRDFIERYPTCRTIVSSRWTVEPTFRSFKNAQLEPFQAQQMLELAYHKLADRDDWQEFFGRLIDEPDIYRIAGNPLLLTLLLGRYLRNEVEPAYLNEVLDLATKTLIDEWDSVRGVVRAERDPLSAHTKLNYLRLIADHLDENGAVTFTTSDMSKAFAKISADVPAGDVLQTLQEGTSLISRDEDGRWSFTHRIFQEYFSVLHFIARLSATVVEVVHELIGKSTDALITRFRLVGGLLSDPSELFGAALNTPAGFRPDVATALCAALSQRLVVEPAMLSGFATYIESILKAFVQEYQGHLEISRAQGGQLRIAVESAGAAVAERLRSVGALLRAVHRMRGGTGFEAVYLRLCDSTEPSISLIANFLTHEGNLKSRVTRRENRVELTVSLLPRSAAARRLVSRPR